METDKLAGGTQVLPCTVSPSQGLLPNSLDLSFPFPKEGQAPPKSGNNMEGGKWDACPLRARSAGVAQAEFTLRFWDDSSLYFSESH